MIHFFQMPERLAWTFTVKSLRILNDEGQADSDLMPPLSSDEIKEAYELMLLSRTFDQRALSLQREGRIGTYASLFGQEAAQVGSAMALKKGSGDRPPFIFPSFREMAVYIALGYPMHKLFQYWAGDERGMQSPEGFNIFPICIAVGTHIPQAVGAAMAMKLKGIKGVAAVYFGDGGTSKGDFHEGLNMAGVFNAPVVFICQNNQWAISVPRRMQSASTSLAQKALAYGFDGIQVDGNDLFAVYKATADAVHKAKEGGGPTLIECFTYRLSDHTTADDSSRYREKSEVDSWLLKDPIKRLRLYMKKRGLLDDEHERQSAQRAVSAVDEAVKEAESAPPPSARDMFVHTYKELTPRQAKQMREGGWP